jgi:hypothetical protein
MSMARSAPPVRRLDKKTVMRVVGVIMCLLNTSAGQGAVISTVVLGRLYTVLGKSRLM